jgi:Meckel syndrome type 1 protein
MNTPSSPIDPLEPHERELAWILRALPGGEPPPALDARILRAAHDALAQPAPRRRMLLAGGSSGALWGIGSAAAAILAVGIGYKLTVPPDSSLPVPRSMPVSTDSTADQEATAVEFRPLPERRQDAAADAAPPPPPAELKQEQVPRRRVAMPPPAPVMAPAPAAPEPFPQAEEFQYSAPADAATAESDSAGFNASAPSPPAAAATGGAGRDARSAYSERQRDEALGRLSSDAAKAAAPAPGTVGEREVAAQATVAKEDVGSLQKRVEADGALARSAWLDRIRARAQAGDMAGARASLRLFVERHPHYIVPNDLRPLLDE